MHKSPTFAAILLTFSFFTSEIIFADQESFPSEDLFDFNMSIKNDGVLAAPPAVFSHKAPSTYIPQIPKVNVITGEYCEEEEDLVVAGIEPISIRRFYNHNGHKNQAYGHWNINPETLMLFNFTSNRNPTYAGAGDENGGLILCEKAYNGGYVIDPGRNKSFTHAQTGQCHPLNVQVSIEKCTPKRFEYYWKGEVKDGSGRTRSYATEIGLWKDVTRDQEVVSQARIKEDRKPNGNVLRYTYEDFNGSNISNSHYKQLNTLYILRKISSYSSSGVLLSSVDLNYINEFRGEKEDRRRYIKRIEISGSDGRKATFHNLNREVRMKKTKWRFGTQIRPEIRDVVLDRVETSWKPTQNYIYQHDIWERYFEAPFMVYAGQDKKHGLATTYDNNSKKVIAQHAFVGTEGEKVPIARYEYSDDHTDVYDADNNRTIFRFDPGKRITAVEKYQDETLYKVDRFTWQADTGNLLSKRIEDSAGELYHLAEYVYDNNHNAIEECIGVGKEKHTIYRTFSDDGFNLLLTESDRPERLVRHTYVPGTNLPSSEIVYENDQIRRRTFHFYDPQINAACVRTVIDDGTTDNPDDISDITYRKIIEIQPKRELPCVGLPEEVQEKTIDASGNEILLKKIRYAYHPSGKIAREDHYDANDLYRFSLINEYNEKEQLISTIDPLGNLITREYDEHYNLTALSGPREDMRKEWTYDFANRPTEEVIWRADGTPLKKEIQYDKLGRVVSVVDEKNLFTSYHYDALGRVMAITHPGGTKEYKEYDVLGNVIKEIDPNGYETHSEYNDQGKPTKITYPDGSGEQFSYNLNGTLATHTDKNGAITQYTYDSFDNPIKTEIFSKDGPLLKTTSATFSPFAKLSETDGEGITTYYLYDFAGRKIGEKVLDREIAFEYDALGRVEKTIQDDTCYIEKHDDLGRVTEKRTETSALVTQVKYQYDPADNRTHTITSKGVKESVYDATGQPLQVIDPLGQT
ncbi:MAG: tRNA nuclease WapA [Chlamydiae bacterium]|nr:tRNA nuclease WapA [Chlamydiota bacterium]